MVRGQIAYKSHPRVLSKHHYRFQSENRQKGNAAEFLKAANFSLAFIQAIVVTTESVLPLNQSAFLLHACAVGKAIFDTRKYADYAYKLAPLGSTHIRHGSSTPEANSKSSSPLKEWMHTHNWGGYAVDFS